MIKLNRKLVEAARKVEEESRGRRTEDRWRMIRSKAPGTQAPSDAAERLTELLKAR